MIGVDIHDAEVEVDLSTAAGRAELVTRVTEESAGKIDAIIANAGLATPTATTVAVNYFGTVATLTGLRPLLVGSPAPRAVATASMASLFPPDQALLDALLLGDEAAALARAAELEAAGGDPANQIYGTTKRALALWIRRNAAKPEWAGAGIPLNAIAPGVVETPMTAGFTGARRHGRPILTDGPDAAERHLPAARCRVPARLADERRERAPVRPGRLHRRRLGRRDPRGFDLVKA